MAKKIYQESKRKGRLGSDETKKKGIEFNFGLSKFSFGGIFDCMGKLIDLAERAEKAGGELRREGTIKGFGGRKDIRGVYGFTVRTGLGKSGAHVETFGNIKKTKKGPKVAETREPIVDIFDEKEHVSVIAELPGVAERDIKMNFKGDILILEAASAARKYSKEIVLPTSVDTKNKEVKFHNGILEIKLAKVAESKSKK